MARKSISMRHVKDILRLKHHNQLSVREIARSCGLPVSTVVVISNELKLLVGLAFAGRFGRFPVAGQAAGRRRGQTWSSAINTYIGSENKIADYVDMVRTDLMGIVREDLVYSLGAHVDQSVHDFQDWACPSGRKTPKADTVDGQTAKDEELPLRRRR